MPTKKRTRRRYSVDAVCPYYCFDDERQKIVCEGVQEGASLRMVFSRHGDFVDYQQARCNACYQQCPLYRMLLTMRGCYGG